MTWRHKNECPRQQDQLQLVDSINNKSISLFLREHGVHAGPTDYFVVVVVVVVRG
jgi:hypothetical protein